MNELKKILAIPGSIRKRSTNLQLIEAIIELTTGSAEFQIFKGLPGIPHFNPDLDTEDAPIEVTAFRRQLREADGILICTPEYAMGVPGTLKNAIDWTVSSCEFSHKPVALITASSSGMKAHLSLLDTLRVIESDIPADAQLLIPFVKTKVSSDGKITDPHTLIQIKVLMSAFFNAIEISTKS